MGTVIELTVGGVALAWSKNAIGADHGVLFQDADLTRLDDDGASDDVGEDHAELGRSAFSRSLRSVVPRIELLGFTLGAIRQAYGMRSDQWVEQEAGITEEGDELPEPATFDEFVTFLRAHPVSRLDDEIAEGCGIGRDDEVRGRFAGVGVVDRIPVESEHRGNAYSERSFFGTLIDFLHPYAALRVLAENPDNLDLDVRWEFGPLVDAGWAEATDFVAGARREQQFLIATEGTSDIHILSHAIERMRPGIADFFRFIDVSERHPFSGTGNLTKFAEGLVKIDVQNKIVFLFDNDAEGVEAHESVMRMPLPNNMRCLVLPNHDDFQRFPSRGPTGLTEADINGRAAAIECYLDLRLDPYGPPVVRWTNFKEQRNVYHGSLEFKDSYKKHFLEQTADTLRSGAYDTRKLDLVLAALSEECCALAVSANPLDGRRPRW